MKQLLFLMTSMGYLTFRSFYDPFWAVLMYYGLAVLRPQALWNWALPEGIRWSLYAAILAIVLVILRPHPIGKLVVQRAFLPLLFVFVALLLVSYVGAIDPQIARESGWEYAKILIMLVVASCVITERRHLRYLAWMIFLSLIYIVYEMNALYVFDQRLQIYHYGLGGYDNNGIALALAMVIPFCYFFFYAEHRWRRWAYLACAIPAVHAVMLSCSRGAMLSSLVVGIGMLACSLRRHLIQTLGIALVMLILVAALAGPGVRERFSSIGEKLRDPSAQSRYLSWRAGWRIARDHPLIGVGLRNSNLLTKDYGADLKGRTIHNIYLQIAADAGVPACMVFITLLGVSLLWMLQAARASRDGLDDFETRWHHHISYAVFWSTVTFAVGGMFLSFESFEMFYLLLLMGAAAPALASRRADRSVPATTKRPKVAMLSLGDMSA